MWWLPFATSQCRALTVRGPMVYLRKPNKLGVICNSVSDLPAIGPHLLLINSNVYQKFPSRNDLNAVSRTKSNKKNVPTKLQQRISPLKGLTDREG